MTTTVDQDIQASYDAFLKFKSELQCEMLHEAIVDRDNVIENMMAAVLANDMYLIGSIVTEALRDYAHDMATVAHPTELDFERVSFNEE